MQIEERVVNNVTILDLKGKITLGEGDEALKDKINSLIQQDRKRILLNLAEVPYIDSAGLGEIVRTYTTVSRQGGQLKLVYLTKRITDLLSITKLLTVFETFESEPDALKSYCYTSGDPHQPGFVRGGWSARGAPFSRDASRAFDAASAVDEEPLRLRGPHLRRSARRLPFPPAGARGVRGVLPVVEHGLPHQRHPRS
jgi:anti-sigma B factor antagonist